VTAIAHRVFLDPQTREPILAVGIETDAGGSSLDELSAQSVSPGMDWEVRLSEGFIVQSMAAVMHDLLGGLPPPRGLSSTPIPGVPEASLDRLDFAIAGSRIAVTGTVSLPIGTADFSVGAMVWKNGNGIGVTLDEPEVDPNFLGDVLNFLSGGGVVRKIRDAVSGALEGVQIEERLGGFFSDSFLSQLASGGPLVPPHGDPRRREPRRRRPGAARIPRHRRRVGCADRIAGSEAAGEHRARGR
jgi:hypothetical protein